MHNPESNEIGFLKLDCDHNRHDLFPGWLPTPIAVVIDKKTGRFHLIFRLKTPVLVGKNARLKPIKLLAAVQKLLTVEFDADPSYNNLLCKNPCHYNYDIILNPTAEDLDLGSLKSLLEADEGRVFQRYQERREIIGYGRHMTIFHKCRYWAYDAARTNRYSREELYERAHLINLEFSSSPTGSLFEPEVSSIVHSIDKFILTRYEYGGTERYTKMSEKEKRTIQNIISSVENIKNSGQKPHPELVAYIAGIGRMTLERYVNKHGLDIT
jgi:hypothetical protein